MQEETEILSELIPLIKTACFRFSKNYFIHLECVSSDAIMVEI